jgi:hypothetical protein
MALLKYGVTLSCLSLLLLRIPVGITEEPSFETDSEEPTSCACLDMVALATGLWTGLNVSEPDTRDS